MQIDLAAIGEIVPCFAVLHICQGGMYFEIFAKKKIYAGKIFYKGAR